MTAGFTKPSTTNSSATLEMQGPEISVSIPFGCRPLVSFWGGESRQPFPDGRKTLFSVGGIQDFRDGIGHQVAVFFQQPAGCSVRSAGLSWIEELQSSLHALFGYP